MSGKRVPIMLGVMLLLAVLVVFDRMSGESDDAVAASGLGLVSARDAYLERRVQLASDRVDIETTEAWRDLRAETEAAWNELRREVILAPSRQLAMDRLRDRTKREMQAVGIDPASLRATPLPNAGDDNEHPVKVVSMTLSFTAEQPAPVYRLIERLENLPGMRTRIRQARLAGPGVQEIPQDLDVMLTIDALAIIGEES